MTFIYIDIDCLFINKFVIIYKRIMSSHQKFVPNNLLINILLNEHQLFFLSLISLSLVTFVTMTKSKCHNGLQCPHPECDYEGTKFGLQQHFNIYPRCHKFFTMDKKHTIRRLFLRHINQNYHL